MKRIIIVNLVILSLVVPVCNAMKASNSSSTTPTPSPYSLYNPSTWNWKSYYPWLGGMIGTGLSGYGSYLGARKFANYIPEQYRISAALAAAAGTGLLGYTGAGLGAWYQQKEGYAEKITDDKFVRIFNNAKIVTKVITPHHVKLAFITIEKKSRLEYHVKYLDKNLALSDLTEKIKAVDKNNATAWAVYNFLDRNKNLFNDDSKVIFITILKNFIDNFLSSNQDLKKSVDSVKDKLEFVNIINDLKTAIEDVYKQNPDKGKEEEEEEEEEEE